MELKTLADIRPLERHRVEDVGKYTDAELGALLKGIFGLADIPGTIKKLKAKELYLLADGVAKKPLANLPVLAPVVATAAVGGKTGAATGSVAAQKEDGNAGLTDKEIIDLNRRLDEAEKNGPERFGEEEGEDEEEQNIPIRSVPAPTADERALAAQDNAQPNDGLNSARFAAREKVVRDFYEGRPGLGQERASQDLGCHPATHVANQHPDGYGIDLSKPVKVVDIPPPDKIPQYVKKHGTPGNFFDPIGGQSADAMGLNGDPSIRRSKVFDVPSTTPKQQALISRNGPVIDSWTNTASPTVTKGGGSQMTVDNITKSSVKPQPQPW